MPRQVPLTRKGVPGSWDELGTHFPEQSLTPPHQIVFDECHKAKNASSTKMGRAVLDLQNKLPLARVVYASATGEGLGGCGRGVPDLTACAPSATSALPQPWGLPHATSALPVCPCCFLGRGYLAAWPRCRGPCLCQMALAPQRPGCEGFPESLRPGTCLRPFLGPCPAASMSGLGELTAIPQPPGASEPRNMIYMSRLGIWGEGTPFRTFEEFLHAIEKR